MIATTVYINAIIQIVYVVKISTKEATTNCCVHVQVSRCFVNKQHISLLVVAVCFITSSIKKLDFHSEIHVFQVCRYSSQAMHMYLHFHRVEDTQLAHKMFLPNQLGIHNV